MNAGISRKPYESREPHCALWRQVGKYDAVVAGKLRLLGKWIARTVETAFVMTPCLGSAT